MTNITLKEVQRIASEIHNDICDYVNSHKDEARWVVGGEVVFFSHAVDTQIYRVIKEILIINDYLNGNNREF